MLVFGEWHVQMEQLWRIFKVNDYNIPLKKVTPSFLNVKQRLGIKVSHLPMKTIRTPQV